MTHSFLLKRSTVFFTELVFGLLLLMAMSATASAAENTAARFGGSFLNETGTQSGTLWYVHPVRHERYGIANANDFSRLLSKVGEGIRNRDLRRIEQSGNYATLADYRLAQRFRGKILLNVDADGRAWYLNPLDDKRYELANGQAGFDAARSVALDISPERLAEIAITKDLGFDRTPPSPDELSLPQAEGVDSSTYSTMFGILREDHLYRDTFTDSDLFYGSLKGMAAGTSDLNTEFYPPEKNRQQQSYFQGGASIEGIGAVLNARENSLYVVSLIKGSPAERAGLKPKDQIIRIGDQSTEGISIDRAVSLIKGPAGTAVTLTIYRAADGLTRQISVTRERVEIPSVEGETLEGTVAYFKFTLFTADLLSQFQRLSQQLITAATQGVIIDMRDNPGGVTSSAAQLADNWLTQDQVIYSERRPGMETHYVASGVKTMPNVPTAILVNDETASASEIFTSALQYHHQATVIGAKTYGKGTGQNLVNFADGSGLKYTIFEWIPPTGTSIDKIGITPDITVQQSASGDAQLDRARQFIRFGF